MKTIRITVILSIIALISVAFIVSPDISDISKKNKVKSSGSLLWKIEKEGLPGISYIYGTIHMMPKEKFFMAKDAQKALKASDALALEANIDMTLKEQIAMAKKIMLPAGKTYQDYMSKEDYDALYDYLLNKIGIKESKVNRYLMLKPFNLAGLVLNEHYDVIEVYEMKFTKMAKKGKKEILELEGMDFQLNLFDSIGMSMMFPKAKDLIYIKEFEKLMDAYITKDLSVLEKAMNESLVNASEKEQQQMDLLINSRNSDWAPKIDKMVHKQTTFIAVGAGHLYGDKGVIALLKAKGYTLTPMEL